MDIIPTPLIETGESEAVPEGKTPLQMANESHESASVAWVKYELEKHGKHCPAIRSIRSLRAYMLVGAGFILSASMWGTVTIQASLRADRLELKDEFRSIIREEIGKVAVSDPPIPSPLVYPPVTPAIVPAVKARRATSANQASAAVSPAGARFTNPLHYLQAVR